MKKIKINYKRDNEWVACHPFFEEVDTVEIKINDKVYLAVYGGDSKGIFEKIEIEFD